jgi:hypothetical protein
MSTDALCRLIAHCSTAASEQLISRLYSELPPLGVRIEHITIRNDGGNRPVEVDAFIACDAVYRDAVAAFVKSVEALPGMLSVDCKFSLV